jgi:NADPH-dependent 2,4-dienoyl-CoA reductase/sulfur reductase-like enzyme
MTAGETVIVGAGPAGMRAAITLVEAGRRPIVIDEAPRSGGQIYRRPPQAIGRDAQTLYGFEAGRATRLHRAFEALGDRVDYRPGTLIWNATDERLHLITDGRAVSQPWRRVILAPGAMDRVIPLPGWTLPGAYTLGGAQVALKAQALSIGARVVFFGTGPLLYLVAYQYAKAGIDVRAVLDTTPGAAAFKALPGLLRGGRTFLKGLHYVSRLRARGVRIARGIRPVEISAGADDAVSDFRFQSARGREESIMCDAVAFGYGLKSETQLADLLGLNFNFNHRQRQWLPVQDADGRSSVRGIYLAGDGALVRGADVAELAGERAALTLLADDGESAHQSRIHTLSARITRAEPFRRALDEVAFPFPAALAQDVPDEVMICRCEGIDARTIRDTAAASGVADINRLKAFTRLGMGRCQGRVCGPAAAEILAATAGVPVEAVGRLRGQAPIKPVPLSALARTSS